MEKAAAFGLPFFQRALLPGGLLTLAALPLLVRLFSWMGVASAEINTALVISALATGVVLSVLVDPIYRVYEGLLGWPSFAFDAGVRSWQARVDKLWTRQQTRPRDYDQLWGVLQTFPTDERRTPIATRPTRLGNMLRKYEHDYPYKRYGLSGPFYWSRLWLVLDKDTREMFDRDWSIADGLVLSSAGAALVAVLYVGLALVSTVAANFGLSLGLNDDKERLLAATAGGLGPLIVSVACYRLALPVIWSNGQTFMATFDMYRSRLDVIRASSAPERKHADRLRQHLQFEKRWTDDEHGLLSRLGTWLGKHL